EGRQQRAEHHRRLQLLDRRAAVHALSQRRWPAGCRAREADRARRQAQASGRPTHPAAVKEPIMKLLSLALACAAFGATAHAEPFAATAVSGPETWKKYDVRGIALAMSRKDLVKKGFKCGKRANSRCYKLMDKRCDKGRCELKEDAFGQWFELNGAKTQLDYMTCATTETDSALVYDCRLKFGPRQVADGSSALGKALIAKY